MNQDNQPDKVIKKYLRADFSNEDRNRYAQELAIACHDKTSAEEEKKAVTSDFKAKIDNLQSEISKLSIKISQGWEMRNVECLVYFNNPEKGLKRIVRSDTGEQISVEAMDSSELQQDFDFESQEESPIDNDVEVVPEAPKALECHDDDDSEESEVENG